MKTRPETILESHGMDKGIPANATGGHGHRTNRFTDTTERKILPPIVFRISFDLEFDRTGEKVEVPP
jgi:hypothetical protein